MNMFLALDNKIFNSYNACSSSYYNFIVFKPLTLDKPSTPTPPVPAPTATSSYSNHWHWTNLQLLHRLFQLLLQLHRIQTIDTGQTFNSYTACSSSYYNFIVFKPLTLDKPSTPTPPVPAPTTTSSSSNHWHWTNLQLLHRLFQLLLQLHRIQTIDTGQTFSSYIACSSSYYNFIVFKPLTMDKPSTPTPPVPAPTTASSYSNHWHWTNLQFLHRLFQLLLQLHRIQTTDAG